MTTLEKDKMKMNLTFWQIINLLFIGYLGISLFFVSNKISVISISIMIGIMTMFFINSFFLNKLKNLLEEQFTLIARLFKQLDYYLNEEEEVPYKRIMK